jgi:hypothetical protein
MHLTEVTSLYACEVVQLFSVVFCVVRALHKACFRLVINGSTNKWQPWKEGCAVFLRGTIYFRPTFFAVFRVSTHAVQVTCSLLSRKIYFSAVRCLKYLRSWWWNTVCWVVMPYVLFIYNTRSLFNTLMYGASIFNMLQASVHRTDVYACYIRGAFNNLSTWVRKKQLITKKNFYFSM